MFTDFNKLFLSTALVGVLAVGANAQFDNYSIDEGLSFHSVDHIGEDDEGLIYASTGEGLNVFNGSSFERYHQGNTPGFSNNVRISVCVKKGFVLIGTRDRGLYLLNKYKQKITPIPLGEGLKRTTVAVSAIHQKANDSTIWVGCGDGSLYTFSSSEIHPARPAASINVSKVMQRGARIESIENWGDHVFVAGNDSVVSRITRVGDRYAIDAPLTLGARSVYCQSIVDGNLLLGTDHGIYRWEGLTDPTMGNAVHLDSPWKLKGHKIRTLSRHHDNIWAGTEGDGLYKLGIQDGLSEQFTYSDKKRKSLSSNYVLHTYIDTDDNLWVGSWYGGMDMLELRESNLTFIYDRDREKDRFSNIVWRIVKTPEGRIFLGTHGNGLCEYFPDGRHFATLRNNDQLKSIGSLYYDGSRNMLYIGTWGHGLKMFDPSTDQLRPVNEALGLLDNERIYAIEKGVNDQLWIGTFHNGLYRYDLRTEKLEKIGLPIDHPMEKADIRCIIWDDGSNKLWVASLKAGLYQIAFDHAGKMGKIGEHQVFEGTTKRVGIRNLYKDRDGKIWAILGDGRGIVELNGANAQSSILQNKVNTDIEIDRDGHFWAGTYRGIFSVDPRTFQAEPVFANTTVYDLLYEEKSNTLLAASHDGLVRLDLSLPRQNPVPPKILLSNLRIIGQPISPEKRLMGKKVLDKKLSYCDTVVLPYFSRAFSMDINALLFGKRQQSQTGGNRNRLRYRLKNFDKQWNEADFSTTVSYTNLDPGTYQLQVQVADRNNTWTQRAKRLTLIKERPWWANDTALLLYFLLIATVCYYIYREVRARIKLRQALTIEKISHEKDQELNRQKLMFFTHLSHDLRTPLTLIVSPLEDLMSTADIGANVRSKLRRMLQNSKMLLSLVNQIMDFRKAEMDGLTLDREQIDLKAFMSTVYHQFHELADSKKIDLELSCPEEKLMLLADPNKLESILFNLLSNAIKFTPRYGSIHLQALKEREQTVIRVEDTGIGIDKKELENLFTIFHTSKKNGNKGTGIGMALVKKYVEAHDGKIYVESTEGVGTRFTLYFSAVKDLEGHKTYDPPTVPAQWANGSGDRQDFGNGSGKKPKILVIDDHQGIRSYLREILSEDFSVQMAGSGEEGLSLAIQKMPDLIICDIMMPDMDGIEVCESIKNDMNTSHIPVLLLTAKNLLSTRLEGYGKGADAYMEKPFNSKLLLTRVHKLIEHRALLRQKFRLMDGLTEGPSVEGMSVDEKFLGKLVSKIEGHISDTDFTIRHLAEHVLMSQDQLYRKIKALTGLSANHFIRLVRLKKAAQLLKDQEHSVSEILYMVGFNNPSYFTKCFKAEFGVCPSEYHRNRAPGGSVIPTK